jgi:hypothetical protein
MWRPWIEMRMLLGGDIDSGNSWHSPLPGCRWQQPYGFLAGKGEEA